MDIDLMKQPYDKPDRHCNRNKETDDVGQTYGGFLLSAGLW